MPRKTQTPPKYPGDCLHCGKTFAKRSMSRHVARCPERPAGKARLAHLVVESADWKDFYLHIECNPGATLESLDDVLRKTWLECCGHMSAFHIGGERYDAIDGHSPSTRIDVALPPQTRFSHEYDYGSTTHLVGRSLGWIEGAPARKPRVVARNHLPPLPCDNCGEASNELCTFCEGTICDACLELHNRNCDEDGLVPAANSPRMGVCGYTGRP